MLESLRDFIYYKHSFRSHRSAESLYRFLRSIGSITHKFANDTDFLCCLGNSVNDTNVDIEIGLFDIYGHYHWV
jgi:hypothetical protein